MIYNVLPINGLSKHNEQDFLLRFIEQYMVKDSYRKFEREYQIIPCIHLNTICNYFNVSLDYIFGFSKQRNYYNTKEKINNKVSGQRLKQLRKQNKITQPELATFLGTVQPTITYYENGKNIISTLYLYNICKKYNISADYLLGNKYLN